MNTKAKALISIGIVGIVFATVFDLLVGRGSISYGPRSVVVMIIGAALIVAGIAMVFIDRQF